MSGLVERFRDNAVQITSTLVTGVWMVGLFTGQDWWLAALLFGYVAVVPVVRLLAGEEGDGDREAEHPEGQHVGYDGPSSEHPDETPTGSTDDALATLRERYASGELTEAQFERKLEQLLEVESVEDASRYADSDPHRKAGEREPAGLTGRNREPEPE